jgi:hypothetical protein
MNAAVDSRAVQILFATYWTASGWRNEPTVPTEDYEYAKAAGIMFEPRRISHDEAIAEARDAAASIEPERVASAFLASLSTRRLDLRSALGSYAIARQLAMHQMQGSVACEICGEYDSAQLQDLNVLSFERIKWGGVRHERPVYMVLDLGLFAQTDEIVATKTDVDVFNAILDTADSLSKTARARDLEKALSRVLRSNKSEREVLLQILGYAGVLDTEQRPGYFDRFVAARDRDLPPANKIDWNYPFAWWRGATRSNRAVAEHWFSSAMRRAV